MRIGTLIGGLSTIAVVLAIGVAGPANAQPYGGNQGGPGWMGPGMMNGYGPGGGGYGPGMMRGYGSGMMRGYGGGWGPGMMYGYGPGTYGNQDDLKLTAGQVKNNLEQMIRNPNLKVGGVKEKDADTIVADIVTKQGNVLVQRLDFNRHNGFVQPEQ